MSEKTWYAGYIYDRPSFFISVDWDGVGFYESFRTGATRSIRVQRSLNGAWHPDAFYAMSAFDAAKTGAYKHFPNCAVKEYSSFHPHPEKGLRERPIRYLMASITFDLDTGDIFAYLKDSKDKTVYASYFFSQNGQREENRGFRSVERARTFVEKWSDGIYLTKRDVLPYFDIDKLDYKKELYH